MNTLTIIILIILALGLFLIARREAKIHGTSTSEELAGICMFAVDQTVRKQANKNKILVLLEQRGELSNAEAREALGVSRRTVSRYMDDLEKRGRVEQVGVTGHAVVYRLVKNYE